MQVHVGSSPILCTKITKSLLVVSLFFILIILRGDLNPLAEGEHNRAFAKRMMGRAHQVPFSAPEKCAVKNESFLQHIFCYSYLVLIIFALLDKHFIVFTLAGHQFIMGTAFNNFSVLNMINTIKITNS